MKVVNSAILFLSLAAASSQIMLPDQVPGAWTEMDPDKWSIDVKNTKKYSPDGNKPQLSFTPPKLIDSTIAGINFYAVGPQDTTGKGSQGCHGAGSQGDIFIPKADFTFPKLCPSGSGGDGNNDYLEKNAASFMNEGNLGVCQLNFYSKTGYKDEDWVGYLTGSGQKKCNAPIDVHGNLIKSLRSFNYICPEA